jgi:hypothetical protein
MEIGTIIGNLFAIIPIAVSGLVGLVSMKASSITFIAVSYTLWLLVCMVDTFTRPSQINSFSLLLTDAENDVYRRYHLHFWFPPAAQAFAALLNVLRFAGFVWGALSVYKGLFFLGGTAIGYYFITGGLILKLYPLLYLSSGARRGNDVAIEELSLIRCVQEKREIYNHTQGAT